MGFKGGQDTESDREREKMGFRGGQDRNSNRERKKERMAVERWAR